MALPNSLAWRIALSRINPCEASAEPPGFASGLIVHPLNPKAWVMITAGFTGFVTEGTPAFTATLGIATVLLTAQIVLQPLWCWGGERLSAMVSGRPAERWIMLALAGATVLSVVYAIASEGTAWPFTTSLDLLHGVHPHVRKGGAQWLRFSRRNACCCVRLGRRMRAR